MFNRKGQGSLEYLLLIGGAVLVAAIVIGLVVTSSQSTGYSISSGTQKAAACAAHTSCSACVIDTANACVANFTVASGLAPKVAASSATCTAAEATGMLRCGS